MSKRGKFISFEGGEGVGKTTQVRLLDELISTQRRIDCVVTREPGGSPYAEEIRNLILGSACAGDASAGTMFELFWAARVDHVDKVIRPALNRGLHVITDRFDGTTFSHQICGQENNSLRPLFFQKRELYLEGAEPDLYIILDIEPEIGLKRVAERRDEPMNHFDRRELAFHRRLRKGCHEFANLFPSVIIDANQSVELVHQDIVRAVQPLL